MGQDFVEVSINVLKLIVIFLLIVQAVPVLVWLERRGSALIQNRLGPNRVGWMGLMQLLADAVKFLFKEEFVPEKGIKVLYYAAPVVALIPATLAFCAIPLGHPIKVEAFHMLGHSWGPYVFPFQGYDMNIGIVFVLGVSSLAAYSLLLAGWGSGNKYSLLGALRASSQVISYELALGLAVVSMVLFYGTLNLSEMIRQQQGVLVFQAFGQMISVPWLPNWGIFYQPIAAILFFAATFAESNRLPFDLPEGEAELVAGFHVEYGGFKMLLFFIGEYGHMMVASALMTVFFFGGYQIPFVNPDEVYQNLTLSLGSSTLASVVTGFLHHLVFFLKFAIFLWIFIQVRWTLPRFRYDQLMDLGWRTMLPWALGNTMVTALVIFILNRSVGG
ncbi:MAG: NADH-quinone oxidoreductase subunit H [Bdellovibrio sp.]|nr:MAG: NADH-quinone oxidoreductase subunit H [Bdellovibrio sp.]